MSSEASLSRIIEDGSGGTQGAGKRTPVLWTGDFSSSKILA